MNGVYLKYNNNKIINYDNFITMHRFLKQNSISYSSCIIYPSTKDNLMDKKNPIKIYPIPIMNRKRSPYYDIDDDNNNYYDIDDNYNDYDNNDYDNNDYDIDDNHYYDIDNNDYYDIDNDYDIQ